MEIMIVSWLNLIVVSGKYENKYSIFFIHLYYYKLPLEFLTKKILTYKQKNTFGIIFHEKTANFFHIHLYFLNLNYLRGDNI